MKRLVKKLLGPIYFRAHGRDIGTKLEVKFWEEWFRAQGMEWKDAFKKRLDPAQEVEGYHRDVLDRRYKDGMKILDVGSGPVSAIHSCYKGKQLHITACDPLADYYDKIMTDNDVPIRRRVLQVKGEEVGKFFHEKFDWINCQNALDHAEDPGRVIDGMIDLLTDEGIITLAHAEDEGVAEAYRGFHKWNIRQGGEDGFIIWNPGRKLSFASGYRNMTIKTTRRRNALIYTEIWKG